MDNKSQTSDSRGLSAQERDGLLAKGKELEREGFYTEAVGLYEKMLDEPVPRACWHYRLGCTYLKMGQAGAAVIAFRDATDCDADNPRYLTNLGVALDRLGKRDEAVRFYKRATLFGGGTVVAHHNLGAIYAEEGRIEEAARAFNAAIALEPDAEGHHNLGLVYYRIDEFRTALDCFRQAVGCDPKYAIGYYYAGLCLLKTGNYKEAVHDFRRAAELDQHLTRVAYHLGRCLHKLEHFKDARAQLETALDAFPEDGRIHYQLALTCDALGLHPEARAHYGHASSCRDEARGTG